MAVLPAQRRPVRRPEDLGAEKLAQYLSWKWKTGIAQDGKLIGFPIDIGPVAHVLPRGPFAKAGLPTDPTRSPPS